MSKCEQCSNEGVKSSIVADYYYRSLCYACYDHLIKQQSPSTGQADYDRGRDIEEHEADIIQPNSGGRPSAEFIHLYPKQAKLMFTPDEIDQATRS